MGWGHAPAAGVGVDTVVAANTGHNYAHLACSGAAMCVAGCHGVVAVCTVAPTEG